MSYKCREGWLLSKSSTDGSLVPFFIHTRSKDIHHSLKDDFSSEILKLVDTDSVSINYASSTIRYETLNWGVEINSNESCEMTQDIALSNAIFTNENDDTDIVAHISLPLSLKNDPFINISVIVNTETADIGAITPSTFKLISKDNNSINSISVRLNKSTKFPSDRNVDEYINSSIILSIKGNIYFE